MNLCQATIAATLVALPLTSCATSAKLEVSESYLQTPDEKLLHFRKLGDGPETLIVPSESFMSPDLDRLAQGRTLIYYDLRNRGRSGRAATARLEKDLADLEAVFDWFELEQATLVGFDYAAALSALFAAEHPERVQRLVLVSPLPLKRRPFYDIYERVYDERVDADSFQHLRELERGNARRLDREAWGEAYKETVLSGWVDDLGSLERMRANPLVSPNLDPEPLHRQYRGLLGNLGDWDWTSEVARVTGPVLVLHGEHDPVPVESCAEWASTLPRAVDHEIKGSARMPWLEQPRAFFDEVEGFLSSVR